MLTSPVLREPTGAIVVLGSLNTDLVAVAAEIPGPGETVLAGPISRLVGGKGANQAVAAAQFGADVTMIGRLGDDDEAAAIRDAMVRAGVRLDHVLEVANTPSGVACVTVNERGENAIVVSPGANATLTPPELRRHQDVIATGRIAVAQLEIPLETVTLFGQLCRQNDVELILNAAPYRDLPDELLSNCSYLVVNRAEAQALTGVDVVDRAAAHDALAEMMRRGVRGAVLTLGSEGCIAQSPDGVIDLDAYRVSVVDATGAGDAFVGVFAGALARGASWVTALRLAAAAGAWAASGAGAQQDGMPAVELERLIAEQPEIANSLRGT